MSDGTVSESGAIKTMKLYTHVERVLNELREAGVDVSGGWEALPHLSKDLVLGLPGMFLNYGQRPSVELAIQALGLNVPEGKLIVDIGAGLGQPARALAFACPNLRVIGVELQPDQVMVGNALCKAANVDDRCKLVAADFLTASEDQGAALGLDGVGTVDGVVSWLCLLHLGGAGRRKAFAQAFALLKPGGTLYVEDFFRLGEAFTEAEAASLSADVYCNASELPTLAAYQAELKAAGFASVAPQNMTAEWTTFCADRYQEWLAGQERTKRVHNAQTFSDLGHFYEAVTKLWAGGNLGGIRVSATKPSA